MAQAFNPISGPEPMNTNKCEKSIKKYLNASCTCGKTFSVEYLDERREVLEVAEQKLIEARSACMKSHSLAHDKEKASWEERFDKEFGDEIIERMQEYNYTEGHEKPLAEAKKFVSNIKSFISKELARASAEAYDMGKRAGQDERIIKESITSIYKSREESYQDGVRDTVNRIAKKFIELFKEKKDEAQTGHAVAEFAKFLRE